MSRHGHRLRARGGSKPIPHQLLVSKIITKDRDERRRSPQSPAVTGFSEMGQQRINTLIVSLDTLVAQILSVRS